MGSHVSFNDLLQTFNLCAGPCYPRRLIPDSPGCVNILFLSSGFFTSRLPSLSARSSARLAKLGETISSNINQAITTQPQSPDQARNTSNANVVGSADLGLIGLAVM